MKDHDETGSKVHGFILFKEHMGNHLVNSVEETIKEGTVFQKEITKIFINGEDTVPVDNINELKGHRSSAAHSVQVSTGGAKTAVASERDKFKFATAGTAVHGTAIGRIAAVDHFIHVFDN